MNICKGDTVLFRGTGENGEAVNHIGKVAKLTHYRFLDTKRGTMVAVDWGRRWKLDFFLPKELTVIQRKRRS